MRSASLRVGQRLRSSGPEPAGQVRVHGHLARAADLKRSARLPVTQRNSVREQRCRVGGQRGRTREQRCRGRNHAAGVRRLGGGVMDKRIGLHTDRGRQHTDGVRLHADVRVDSTSEFDCSVHRFDVCVGVRRRRSNDDDELNLLVTSPRDGLAPPLPNACQRVALRDLATSTRVRAHPLRSLR